MTSQPDYLRYLETAQQAHTAEVLTAEGYTVARNVSAGDAVFDLVASKGGQHLAYEFKAGRSARTSRENLIRLQQAAKIEGFEFHIIVVNPPPKVNVYIDLLRERLLDYMINDVFPEELDRLSTHTSIESVSQLTISDLRAVGEEVKVSGGGSIAVRLLYGSQSDQENDFGASFVDSYPFYFRATLGTDLELVSVDELTVDTSSFYEE